MDNLESKIESPSTPEQGDLARQVESLRQMLISVLVLVIVISGTINVYLLRQVKYTRADLAAFRTQATQTVSEFEKISAPMLNQFLTSLSEFGKSPRADANFHAILKKYGLSNFTNMAPVAPAQTSTAPATTPVPAPTKK
jgi:hypothetical protein